MLNEIGNYYDSETEKNNGRYLRTRNRLQFDSSSSGVCCGER